METPESSELVSTKKIRIPTPEEIATLSAEELHCGIWRENNAIFIDALEKKKPRYVGFHGAPGKNLQLMQRTKTARVNIGTFFNKDVDPEFFLTVLYDMCHTQFYAFDQPTAANDPGGVMIIDMEVDGVNRSLPWELLNRSSYNVIELNFHTEEDLQLMHANHPHHANRKKENAQRSDAILTPASFDQRLIGVYPYEQRKSFEQKFSGPDIVWRLLVQKELSNQNMLKFCLEKMGILEG